MEFKEGLNYVYQTRTRDEELVDPFMLYCKLSDLCGSRFEDKRKVETFYNVDKRVNLVKAVLAGDKTIYSKYESVSDLLTLKAFESLIEMVKTVLNSQYKPIAKPSPSKQKNTALKVVVTRVEEPEEIEQRTPLTSAYTSNGDIDVIIGLSVIGGMLLSIGLLVLFAIVFSWPWTVWQWLIGIIGGIFLLIISVCVVSWFDFELIINYCVLGTWLLGIIIVINFVLALCLKGNYKIMFVFFSVFEIMGGIVLATMSSVDLEDKWFVAQVVEILATVLLFVGGLIWL